MGDQEAPMQTAAVYKAEMLRGFDDKVWAFAVTMGGKAQINAPGWEITRQWDKMYQAIAISSHYRFVGQGVTPRFALEAAEGEMRKFKEELERHLEAYRV